MKKKVFLTVTLIVIAALVLLSGCFPSLQPGDSTPSPEQPAAPILSPIGDKIVNEGELLTFTVLANDANGDVLQYAAQNLPEGATFDSQLFSWQPSFNQSSAYHVSFTVSDGSLSDTENITIAVLNVILSVEVEFFPDEVDIDGWLWPWWIAAFVELPPGYYPSQIDLNSVKLNGTVSALNTSQHWFLIADRDEDGLLERIVRFDWDETKELLVVGNNTLSVSGNLFGWPLKPEFSGNSTLLAFS